MASPTDAARYGHRHGLYLYNNTSEETEIWADRVQAVSPEARTPITKGYEIGRIGPTGAIADNPVHRITFTENLHNSEIDSYLAGKAPATSGSLFNVGELLGNSIRASIVNRAIGGSTPESEHVIDEAVLESIAYTFQLRAPCTVAYALRGKTGRWYTSGSLVHESWGTLDTSSAAGVNGRDARIFFTTDSNKGYRIQRFVITVRLPVTDVGECGTRDLVGQVQDSPDVTCEFDILHADDQPNDEWYTLTNGYYDFNDPLTPDVWLSVYDPSAAEGNTVIKAFKLENVRPAVGSPINATVRGLSTARYSLSSILEDTQDEGGMYVGTSAIT